MRIAILDDYQGVALKVADWAPLHARAEITVFSDHLADEEALAERLAPFEVLCVMRERTVLGRSLLERLPKLRFIASTGPINAAIDVRAAEERGIEIAHTATRAGSDQEIQLSGWRPWREGEEMALRTKPEWKSGGRVFPSRAFGS